jgi:hypothetical protein
VETWQEVEAQARTLGVEVLANAVTERITGRFTDAYVADPGSRWWWNTLRETAEPMLVRYRDDDAWVVLRGWLAPEGDYILLVTDEEPEPAGAVRASAQDLERLVRECSYFEYVITDERASFGIFDTHHNVLIAVGALSR